MSDRIVVLVDMDCFYCQVETRLNPSLKGKPLAVVQYNQWQGGGIIAVNYEARAFGVTRSIRGNEAKKMCPDIALVHVPSIRGKADLTRYRDAGREVVDVLCRFSDTVQKASVDEAYLDITHTVNVRHKELGGNSIKPEQLPNTFVVGYSENSNDEDKRREGVKMWLNGIFGSELQNETLEKLAVAACVVEEMRAAIFEVTGFHCSAGIAHNKILSKLACGLHKPQRQTVLPECGVPILFSTLPVHKVRGLGGKFGDLVKQRLNVKFMNELLQFSEAHLKKTFDEKSGSWLYNIARGFDDEAVTARLTSKSIGCCKKFPGKLALATCETVEHWLGELAGEVSERLEKEYTEGNRKATQFVVSYVQTINGRDVSSSRCGALTSFNPKHIVTEAMELLKKSNTAPANSSLWVPPLKFLGLSAGKFSEKDSKTTTINSFFKSAPKKENVSHMELEPERVILLGNETSNAERSDRNCFMDVDEKEKIDLDSQYSSVKMIQQVIDNTDREKNKNGSKIVLSVKNNESSSLFLKEEKKEATPKMSEKNYKKTSDSSSKKSFLLNFFKNEGLIKTPTSLKKGNSYRSQDELQNHNEKEVCVPSGPTGKSQEPTTSEGFKGIADRSVRLLQVDDSSNDSDNTIHHWVSPGEIFPNLDEIDEDVAALLPSPMQRQLRTRLKKHKEMSVGKKNKGVGKNKSRKCLVYNGELEDEKNTPFLEIERDICPLNTENGFQNKVIGGSDDDDDDESSINAVERNASPQEKSVSVNDIVDNASPNKCSDGECPPLNSSQKDIFESNSPVSIKNAVIASDETKLSNDELSVEKPVTNSNPPNVSLECRKNSVPLRSVKGSCIDSEQPCVEVINDIQSDVGPGDSYINVDESLKELCPHCNQLISLVEYPEHLDFHVAADLDREINRAGYVQTISREKKVVPSGSSPKKDYKRKRSKNESTADKKTRSIKNFFAPVR